MQNQPIWAGIYKIIPSRKIHARFLYLAGSKHLIEKTAYFKNPNDLPLNMRNYLNAPPNWLVSSVLYGLSWCMFFDANLSFLAWFAFVPLFYDLEKKNSFWSFYKTGLFFSVVAYLIICHGFLFTAGNHLLVIAGSANELLMSSFAFALLYPFKKKFGFSRALIMFPFIIALWEMAYQWLDHSYGYLMLSHSQCQNTWIVQFIDLFGVWSIATLMALT